MLAHTDPKQWISYVVTAVILAFVLALRVRRMGQTRPLAVERLWILPALYLGVAAMLFYGAPPDRLGWMLSGAALLLGAALGWQRGRMMRIEVDRASQTLNQQASPGAMLFLLLLVALRFGARSLVAAGAPLHLNALVLADMLVAMALGLLVMQRLEMFLRARRLLAVANQAVG